ncbi:MAG: hypothetical protein QOC35_06855 [Nitrososphaeraceae archaeon]|nr:hypothetical protein [Nitrososphaeraceae archaeon]
MGRKKSNYVCPKCGQTGFLRNNPVGVVHYDHATRSRRTCYVRKLIKKADVKAKGQDAFSLQYPPKKFWGESELFYKLGNIANHLRGMANGLEKTQWLVYRYRPDTNTSAQCVKDLDIFEKGFINPVEKILLPYHDERWTTNWTLWFKIQMDSFKHGPRAAGMINAIETGRIWDLGKDIERIEKRKFTSSQVKKKEEQTLKFALELIRANALEKALGEWSNNTEFIADVGMEQ